MTERRTKGPQPQLPGSVAEVLASPEGPETAAFFDLDGTLVAGFTVTVHTKEQVRNRELGVVDLLRILNHAVAFQAGQADFEEMAEGGLATLAGRALSELDEAGEEVFKKKIADLLYPETRALVRAHQQRGHRVVLCSSATSFQVEPVARYLGIDEVVCNRFVLDDSGALTGKIERPVIWGEGKATAAQRYAATHGIDLRRCYFYADGDEDVALMHLVGYPRPTNPGPQLTKVAKKRGWPITRYTSRGASGTVSMAKTVAGFSTLGPLSAVGVAVGVLGRSKRKGLNLMSSTWPRLLLQTYGVQLNIIGEHNARSTRPAVFLWNHRNNLDAFIAAAVVRDNYTFVAKDALRSHPLLGTVGRLMDGVFIDRSDSASAVRSLKEAEAMLKAKKLSLLIAPEGTRLDTHEVGPFKKGPFHMAMTTGLPLVPIVIRNADDICGRNSATINPGTVDIAVLPPIPTADWTIRDLVREVKVIRQLYLDTLDDWPSEADLRA
ncbi:MAG: HAD-IB family hydrolase [Tetrasphaera sp.]